MQTRLSLLIAAFLVLVASWTVLPAEAESSSAARQRQAAARAAKARVAAQINELKASDVEMERAVRALENQVRGAKAEAQSARQGSSAAEARVAEAEEKARTTERRIVVLRQAVVERAVGSYMRREGEPFDVLGSTGDLNQASRRRVLLHHVNNRDTDVLDHLRAARQDLGDLQAQAREARRLAAGRRREAEAKLGQVERARADKERVDAALDARIRRFEAEADALQREEANLAAIIRRAEAAVPAAGGSGAISAGGLVWPIRGKITSEFGRRWGRMHEGMDIAVSSGTPIKAAKSGTVIFSGQQGGYGKTVVINHGQGFSTVYPHQSRLAATEGQSVERGQLVGYVGCTGSCTGPHLHFETRVNGAAQNPRRYLS